MMTSTELEFDILEVMDEKLGLGRRMAACQRIADHDQAQRAVIDQLEESTTELRNDRELMYHQLSERDKKIEQQAKEIAELRQTCALRHQGIECLTMQVGTLREALQTCQSRLGCGCGDILCTTCSAVYDVAEQTLKEVS